MDREILTYLQTITAEEQTVLNGSKTISRMVGYENIGYFHRIFKETFSISPRNYRLQTR